MICESHAGPCSLLQRKNTLGFSATARAIEPAVFALPCTLMINASSIVSPNAAPSICSEPTPGIISTSQSSLIGSLQMVRYRLYISGSPLTAITTSCPLESISPICSNVSLIFPIARKSGLLFSESASLLTS